MTTLFRNSSPGALTMEQAIAQAKKIMAERRRQTQKARELAAQGRGEDTEVAHVARGEYVIPEALQTPEVLEALEQAAAAYGVPLDRLSAGNAMNSINPNTGAPEFGFRDWFSGLFVKERVPSDIQLPSNMAIPPGVSLSKNISDAESHGSPVWFYNQVRGKQGPWDYKQQGKQYENFGNFNYGATGAGFGFNDWILKRMAGWAQNRAGTSDPKFGHWWGKAPYGDDPDDQAMIQKGIDYYRNGGK